MVQLDMVRRLLNFNLHSEITVILDPTIASDKPLSELETQYLLHVEEGKIIPLTLKEKIKFTNDLLDGHNIELEKNTLAYGIKVKIPKKIRDGKAGRISGQGRGKSTRSKFKDVNLVDEVHIDNMPKSWAALFGK